MVSYRFDLYPRTNPNGTLIRSFTSLQKAAYRAEANGTSTGQIAVRSTTADGQAIDPLGLQYVRVTELPGEITRGGFFLEKGKFKALSEDEDSLLTFSGAGTLSYLSRASMAPHTYISPIFTGQDPFDDTWRLYAQSTAFANGNYLGAMLWRVIYEAQHFTPGSHKHKDGVIYTDTHDDDRTESAIPAVSMTFDQWEDSSGNPWTLSSGEFKAQTGENVLSVVKRLMEAGLYVELDPDTFELNAWEQDTHRAMLDATGPAWAVDVVRFQSPTDPDDITTGNIKDDADRNIEAHIKRSALWAGGTDVYGLATSPGDIPWEGHYRSDTGDAVALEGIAAIQLQAIAEAGDTLKLRLWMEDDPSNGRYLPFQHVKLDQQVTVHTGADQWEFNGRTFPVAALTLELRQGGNWDCYVELGASYSATASRSFQVQGAPTHSHLPNPMLCTPGIAPASGETVILDWDWQSGDHIEYTPAYSTISQAAVGAVGHNGANTLAPTEWRAKMENTGYGAIMPRTVVAGQGYALAPISPGNSVRLDFRTMKAASGNVTIRVEWLTGSYPFHEVTGHVSYATIKNWYQPGTFVGQPVNYVDHSEVITAPSGVTAFRLESGGTTYDITDLALTSLAAGTAGIFNDGNIDLVGYSDRAKRCDDTEHYHTDRNPSTADNWADGGWRHNTLWINETSGAMFLLIDAAAGTWLRLGASETHTHDVVITDTASLNFIIDGGGDVIATGVKGDVVIDYDCTILSATLLADQSGSIVVDVLKSTYAGFAGSLSSIAASAKPTLSSAVKSQDSTLTGWTTAVAGGDVLRFVVDSATTVERATLSLKLERVIGT